jgi:hypothetical protein
MYYNLDIRNIINLVSKVNMARFKIYIFTVSLSEEVLFGLV